MNMFEYRFEKNANYLLACSYGPDSMALLDMLLKQDIKPVVCHINYHKRGETSDFEESSLREYCKSKGLIIEVFDARTIPEEGNFQEWARDVRYDFFSKQYIKYNAKALFVAHHQDDLIETYLMQVKRGGHVKEYGLKRESLLLDMLVVRPLLNYTKKDLVKYDLANFVPYSIDVTNYQNKYLRNKIRHEVIDKLGAIEREKIINEINEKNNEKKEFIRSLNEKITISESLDIRTIISLTKEEFKETIINFVSTSNKHIDISEGLLTEIRKVCLSGKPNVKMPLNKDFSLVKEYDVLALASNKPFAGYSFILKEEGKLSTKYFDIDFSSGASDRNILKEDFPITIRSPKEGDQYKISDYLCSVNRLFIDWKMPLRLRERWPIIENNKGQIIYIPRYRKTFDDNHSSKFVIHLIER